LRLHDTEDEYAMKFWNMTILLHDCNKNSCHHEDVKTYIFWILQIKHVRRMPSSRMFRRVALVRTDVSEEHIASIIRTTRISELRAALTLTSN
jgi:hypothetical protein